MTVDEHAAPRGEAILLAAGQGRRFGAGTSKGFIRIHGRPLLAWSLSTFAQHPSIGAIVVVVPPGPAAVERTRREVLDPFGLTGRVAIVEGGQRRQDSSLRGLDALPASVRDDPQTIVLVHDAARPFVSPFLITRCLRALADHPDASGILPALPIREALKRVSESWVVGTADREGLMAAQTPQVFRLGALREAHARAAANGIAVTDDAALLEAAGARVRIVPGDLDNWKVTYPEDRLFAERVLRGRELP